MSGQRGPRAVMVVVSDAEQRALARIVHGESGRLAQRAGIVLSCAQGRSNAAVAREFSVSVPTVAKWRSRFVELRVDGLVDEPRAGRPKPELVLDEAERAELARWARRAKTSQFLAMRARIVLACADGASNQQVADRLVVCLRNTEVFLVDAEAFRPGLARVC